MKVYMGTYHMSSSLEKSEQVITASIISCSYQNNTSKFQIIRISDTRCYFERAIPAGQRIIFEAYSNAYLEIHTNENITMILSDKIICSQLQKKF
jgi:co-chaperonin GroES (HSP10)